MSDAQPPMGDDDGERGERSPADAEETERASRQADRLEAHHTDAGDAQGLRSSRRRDDAGREADVPHGESGDAG